jgi:hypothetical protein
MQTNTPNLTAAEVTNKILSCKGNFVKVFWKSNPSPAAIHKKAGVVLEKVTNAVVRAGIDFANLTSVKESIANGERGEVQSLPWGEWKVFPYVITHKDKEYIRLYPSVANTPKVKYFVNNEEVDKTTFASYLTNSEANKLLNPEDKPIECFTISADNILGTEDYNELVEG